MLPTTVRLDAVLAAAYERLRDLRIEPPTRDRLDRLVRSTLHAFEHRVCTEVWQRLSPSTRTALETLLAPELREPPDTDGDERETAGSRALLHELRTDAGRATLDNLFREVAKLERIRAIALPSDLFATLAPKVVQVYRDRAAVEAPYELRRHPEALRLTLLAAFCHRRSRELTDTLVDLLLDLIHRISAKAERKVEKALLDDFKRVHGKTGMLYRVAEATLAQPTGVVQDVVFPVVSEATLRDIIKEWKATGPLYRSHVQTVMQRSYRSHYRRMLPRLLETLEFCSNNAMHQPLIRALALLKQYLQSRLRTYPLEEDVPLDGVVRDGWRDVVENWKSANDFILFGNGGDLATNRRDEQEVTMLALHLLQNVLIYINTLMIQRVLSEPAWATRLTPEDLRALTPLIYGHISPYGTFRLDMKTRLDLELPVAAFPAEGYAKPGPMAQRKRGADSQLALFHAAL